MKRILLVGFMGSGKTTVGRLLARELGWRFFDFDGVIEERTGRSVEEIFRDGGEAEFRRIESRVGRELLRKKEVVLASGGGWPAGPGHMDRIAPGTLSVWLQVSAEEAVRRARGSDESPRPLLQVDAPVERARALLEERIPFYRRADLELDTEARSPEGLARAILELCRVEPPRPKPPGHEPTEEHAEDPEG